MTTQTAPRVGSTMHLPTTDGGGPLRVRIVGKLYGEGRNVIAIVVEEAARPGPRITLVWPLEKP